jgi:hypothetical protein
VTAYRFTRNEVVKKDLGILPEVVIIDFEIILAGRVTASVICALFFTLRQFCNKMLCSTTTSCCESLQEGATTKESEMTT